MHLRYSTYGSALAGEKRHAQEVVKDLGIKYYDAEPQPMADQWMFFFCKGVPENLPDYVEVLLLDDEWFGKHYPDMDIIKAKDSI